MFRTAALALALAATVAACGSGGSGKPAHSAASACRSFQGWYLDQGGNILAGKSTPLLHRAVTAAPSGHLYRDISALASDVQSARSAQGTSLGVGPKLLTVQAAYAVEQDCQSVSPSS